MTDRTEERFWTEDQFAQEVVRLRAEIRRLTADLRLFQRFYPEIAREASHA
jgi:hypothetical protein